MIFLINTITQLSYLLITNTLITIEMKPIYITGDSCAECNENPNKKGPKFKVGDHVRISKYKTFLLKDTLQIGQKKFLLLVKLKIQFLGLMLLVT